MAVTNKERYDKVMTEALDLQPQDLNEGLVYNSIPVGFGRSHVAHGGARD
jgi:hypothetical protein